MKSRHTDSLIATCFLCFVLEVSAQASPSQVSQPREKNLRATTPTTSIGVQKPASSGINKRSADIKIAAAEDAVLAAQIKYKLLKDRLEVAQKMFDAATSNSKRLQMEEQATEIETGKLKKENFEECKFKTEAARLETRQKMQSIRDSVANMGRPTERTLERMKLATIQIELAASNGNETRERINSETDRNEWQLDLRNKLAHTKSTVAMLMAGSAKMNWMTASINLLAAGCDVISCEETLANTRRLANGLIVIENSKADKAAADFAKSTTEEALKTAKGMEVFMSGQTQYNKYQRDLERSREAKGDISNNRLNQELINLCAECKSSVTVSIDKLILATDDFAASISKRVSSTMNLPATDGNRIVAISERSAVMLQLTEAKSELLSAKGALKAISEKWSAAELM